MMMGDYCPKRAAIVSLGATVKKLLLATTALTAAVTMSSVGWAKTKTPPPPPVPVYSWTGFYLGLNAGGAWGQSNATTAVNCSVGNYLCNAA
jgi:outer membrane immunogenic protein